MRLTVVGSSGSVSGPEAVASCYLLEADDDVRTWQVLLDLGPGAVGQAMRYVDPAGVDAVLLSHLHADHVADLAGLQVLTQYGPGAPRHPVLVYGPQGTTERVGQLCGEPSVAEDVTTSFDIRTWSAGRPVHLGPLVIEPFTVLHPVAAFAMRITGPAEDGSGTRTLTYSGDTDTCEGLLAAASGADLLLSEAAFQEGRDAVRGIHLTGRRAGEVATEAQVASLVLTHIPPWTCDETVRAEAKDVYTGPIDVARPGKRWQL